MKKFLVAILLTVGTLSSCVSTPSKQQSIDKNTYYRHDLCFEYQLNENGKKKLTSFIQRFKKRKNRKYKYTKEGIKFCGVGVLPFLDKYILTVKSHAKINFFTMRSCHEELTSENPNKGIFKKKDTYQLTYEPTIEKGRACPLFFGAYSRKDKFGTGFITFENPKYQLEATLYCNGNTKYYKGVSVCQSREGLIQKITFKEPVIISKPTNGPSSRPEGMGNCPALELSTDKKSVKLFKMPPRECLYYFGGVISGKKHKLFTIGYEGIILKE